MPTQTPNLNLEKPLGSEKYDINKLNANFDKIDDALGNLRSDASSVTIEDQNNYYLSTDVEGALSEVGYTLSNLPTNTVTDINQLTDESGLIPSDISDLTDTTGIIPSDISDLSDTSNLIPSDVSNLTDTSNLISSKAPLASPALTGIPTAPTATADTNTTQLSTTAFVTNGLGLKANLASPTFTGQVAMTPSTLGTTGTINIDFSGDALRTQGALTGNIVYTGSNYGVGRTVTIRVVNSATVRTLGFPAGWRFLGSKPANIAAFRLAILTITSFGTIQEDCVAAWSAEV